MKINYKKGFTLIELLVVIAIIGILAAASIFGIQGVFENSRDTQRKSDLKQYQTALENYANKNNGLYPRRDLSTGQPDSVLCGDLGLTSCPTDPLYDADTQLPVYRYQTETCGTAAEACATRYVLWATLEDQVDGVYWVVCSNGKVGATDSTPSGGNCPLP
jgi:prepilin-type N-terminal cleavage/methylation domain-containing protein